MPGEPDLYVRARRALLDARKPGHSPSGEVPGFTSAG